MPRVENRIRRRRRRVSGSRRAAGESYADGGSYRHSDARRIRGQRDQAGVPIDVNVRGELALLGLVHRRLHDHPLMEHLRRTRNRSRRHAGKRQRGAGRSREHVWIYKEILPGAKLHTPFLPLFMEPVEADVVIPEETRVVGKDFLLLSTAQSCSKSSGSSDGA